MPFVLDASVVLAWLLPDEHSDPAERLIGRVAEERACAPSLLLLEVGNALLQAERRTRISSATHLDLLGAFTTLPIMLEPIAVDAMLRAGVLARQHTLSLYDGCYLELALTRRCALATFDRKLIWAADSEGVTLLAS